MLIGKSDASKPMHVWLAIFKLEAHVRSVGATMTFCLLRSIKDRQTKE